MARKEWWEKKNYVFIKNDDKWFPKFVHWDKSYFMISWMLRWISTESKKITPSSWKNAWKEITVNNLILELVDDIWWMDLVIDLYSSPARTIINALAWKDSLDVIYFYVYNNKYWYRTMSVKKAESKEQDAYYTPYYTWDEEMSMLETRFERWQERKDYDKLTDKYINELIPIIEQKILAQITWDDRLVDEKSVKAQNPEDDDDLPF